MRLILAALAVCLAMPASAEQPAQCAPRDVQVQMPTERYGERVTAMGLSEKGVVEMWGNIETGTWTVTITRPDGILCGIIAGLNYEAREAAAPGVDG